MEQAVLGELERRLGRVYVRQRLGIERDHEAQLFGQGLNFFHIENWYSVHSLIRNSLRAPPAPVDERFVDRRPAT